MSEMKDFTQATSRMLPVVLLADVSGSMSVEGKIAAMNGSVREMIKTFADEKDLRAQIHLCVITYGWTAKTHIELQPAAEIEWSDMTADGSTPMGEAMNIAADLIEDKGRIPSRAYKPVVINVTDGQPNDAGWEEALARLTSQGRAQKADRIALAIGSDADEGMLRKFLNNPEAKVYHADDASKIKSFFRYVTMSVSTRSKSSNPNKTPTFKDPFAIED